MKTVIAKTWRHVSKLGEARFSNVPVFVDDDFPAERGSVVALRSNDRRSAVGGDIIELMEREVAKQWIRQFVERRRSVDSLTRTEIHGILLALGVNKTEFSRLLRVAKGTVTRFITGDLRPTSPVAQLMLIYLAAELSKAGTVRAVLEDGRALVWGLRLEAPAPKFVIKRRGAA